MNLLIRLSEWGRQSADLDDPRRPLGTTTNGRPDSTPLGPRGLLETEKSFTTVGNTLCRQLICSQGKLFSEYDHSIEALTV